MTADNGFTIGRRTRRVATGGLTFFGAGAMLQVLRHETKVAYDGGQAVSQALGSGDASSYAESGFATSKVISALDVYDISSYAENYGPGGSATSIINAGPDTSFIALAWNSATQARPSAATFPSF